MNIRINRKIRRMAISWRVIALAYATILAMVSMVVR